MRLEKEELLLVQGGGLTGTLISSILKGVETILDLGRNLGSAIRRFKYNNVCPISK